MHWEVRYTDFTGHVVRLAYVHEMSAREALDRLHHATLWHRTIRRDGNGEEWTQVY